MLSEQTLTANLEAATRVIGLVPRLAAPDPARLRFSTESGALRAERRTAGGHWEAVARDTGPIAALASGDPRTVCVIGSGLGETIEGIDPGRVRGLLLAVEPEPGLALAMLARRDWRPWFDAGLVLLVGPDYAGASACARKVDVRVDPLVIEGRVGDETLAGARAVVTRVIAEARANQEARRRFAGRYLTQTLANLPDLAQSGDVASLEGLFGGLPAVIVGAGPSLDDSLDTLAAMQDRALIIASDTTLRPLAAAGIRPHLTVAVDPGEANARHLAGLTGCDETWLVAEGALHPCAFDSFRGRTFAFQVSNHEPWPWLAEHGFTRGRLQAWGSVITSAMDLALAMGCGPIVFVGTDLAFTGDRTYCRGTAHEQVWGEWIARGHTWREVWDVLMNQWPDVRVPDVHGQRARTAPHLVAFRDWVVEQAAAHPTVRIVNATGAGILHGRAVEQGSLRAVLEPGAPLDRRDVTVRLAAAHARARRTSLAAAVAAARQAVAVNPDGALVTRWLDFACGAIDAPQIADALAQAARRLHDGPA